MKIRWALALGISLLFLLCTSAGMMAQTSATGALSGTVTDPTGAVIPNVTVTVSSVDTGQTRTATTNGDGTYKIGLLPPGSYRVKFDAAGFRATEIPSITVTVTETAVLDGHLQIGSQTQEVTVTAEAETVQTANSTLGTVVRNVAELPLATRNYANLLGLSAGANSSVNNAASALGKGTQPVAVNGAGQSDNNYQMDGVSIVNFNSSGGVGESGTFGAFGVPNPDAIQEFKIQTSTYDASYGRNTGGNVNVITRSGTNDFHGTAFEYFRNTALNANDFFKKQSELAQGAANVRPVVNQNQYGGVFGGPIKKDKLFFFVSYQETAQKNGLATAGFTQFALPNIPTGDRGSTAVETAATPWLSALYANFCGKAGSLGGRQVRAPQFGPTAGTCSNGGYNAAVATANINSAAISVLQLKLGAGYYIPSPTLLGSSVVNCGAVTGGASGSAQCTSSVPAIYHEHQAVGNWDYVINSKQTLSGRYFFSTDPTLSPFFAASGLPGEPLSSQFTNDEAVLKLTSVISNTLVNEARVSYQRNISAESIPPIFTSTQVGITPVTNTPTLNLLPQMTIGTFTAGPYQFGIAQNLSNQYQAADQLSWTHGKHSIRAGFEIERYLWNYKFPSLSIGALSFATFPDFLIAEPGCNGGAGCTTANPTTTVDLDGNVVPNNGTLSPNFSVGGATTRFSTTPIGYIHHYRAKDMNAFLQDDFKINSRLTLNLGIRWEWDGQVSELIGENTNVYPALVQTVPFPVVAAKCPFYPAPCAGSSFLGYVVPSNYTTPPLPALPNGVFVANHRVAPQLDPPKDDFAPRLGFAWQPLSTGRFVVRGGAGFFYNRLPGDNVIHAVLQNVPYGFTVPTFPNADLADPYSATPASWQPRYVTADGKSSSNIANQGVAPNLTTPVVYQWNLNTQYEFLKGWVLEVGYVGSRGIHQFINEPINAAQLVSAASPSPETGATLNTQPAALRVPYVGFTPNWSLESTTNDFKYNSAQMTVRKRMSHGFLMQANYTYSRAFVASYIGNSAAVVPGIPAVIPVYGLNPQYHPQRFTVNYSWDLPFPHAAGLAGKFTDGWTVSGVTVIQNGTPLTITDSRLGTVFGAPGPVTSNAQFCAGAGNGSIAQPGSLYQRVVNGLTLPATNLASSGYLNVGAFASAASSRFPAGNCTVSLPTSLGAAGTTWGDGGLGQILGPGQHNWDISLSKVTTVGGLRESATLQFRAEFLNAFNHTQFSNPAQVNVSNAAFGKITSASVNPRLIQFALKYQF